MHFDAFLIERARKIRIAIGGYDPKLMAAEMRKKYDRMRQAKRQKEQELYELQHPQWEDTYIEEEPVVQNNMISRYQFEEDDAQMARDIADLNRPVSPYGANHGVSEDLFSMNSSSNGGMA